MKSPGSHFKIQVYFFETGYKYFKIFIWNIENATLRLKN